MATENIKGVEYGSIDHVDICGVKEPVIVGVREHYSECVVVGWPMEKRMRTGDLGNGYFGKEWCDWVMQPDEVDALIKALLDAREYQVRKGAGE